MSEVVSIGSIGELLVEFVCTEKDTHNQIVASYAGPFPSGAPAIFVSQAAHLGARCIFAGAIGGDAFGKVLLERLCVDKVALDLIRTVPEFPTGTAFVSYNRDGSRDFVFNIACSAAPHFADSAIIGSRLREFRLDVLHVSGSSLADPHMATPILAVCSEMHANGVRISFDPNIRRELASDADYLKSVERLSSMSTYFLPSDYDMSVLFPGRSFDSCAQRLFDRGNEYVVLKRGAGGCRGISRSGEQADFGGHKVNLVDPTGAGDCFCATFVVLMALGKYGLRAALERANAAGALAVTKLGPMQGNSSLAEVEQLLGVTAELSA